MKTIALSLTILCTASMLNAEPLKVVSFGVCIQRGEAEVIANCRMAAELGAEWISVQVPREVMALYAKHAARHGLKVAVHNHGPESALPFYKAEKLLEAMEGMDNVWACPDVGHYARAGVDVLHNLKVLQGRMGLTHLKDMERFGDPKASVVRFGDGVLNIGAMLRAFSEYGLEGYVLIELEGKARHNGVENLKHNAGIIDAFNKTLPTSK
jgi:sugar phosphate isomerase/epimerase